MTTKEIVLSVLKEPPMMYQRFNSGLIDFYMNQLLRPQTVAHLMTKVEDYENINYEQIGMHKVEDPILQSIIKLDFKRLLLSSIEETFYKPPPEDEDQDQDEDQYKDEDQDYILNKYIIDMPYNNEAKQMLETNLCKNLNMLVYNRTNTFGTQF